MMKHGFLLVSSGAALALACCAPEASSAKPDEPPASADTLMNAAKSNNAFSFSLMTQAGGESAEDNFTFSPFSIWSALAMTSGGAEAETLQQMQSVLVLPAKDSHELVSGWSGSLAKAREVEMKVANQLWGRQGLPFRPDFLKRTEALYHAGLETVDFAGNPEGARKQINDWVAGKTKDKIKDLLGQGTITGATELVLTNAIYFMGKWAMPFNAQRTHPQKFSLHSGGAVEAETMSGTFPIAYFEDDRLKAVRLPYRGGDLAMTVILPGKVDALGGGKPFLDAAGFDRVLAGLKEEKRVVVQLPRFEASTRLSLAPQLQKMGMSRAFTDAAQFGPLCEKPLKISDVIHQAWVKVGEEGTEAAAATAVVAVAGSAAPRQQDPPKMFIADHPFLFFITDARNGGIVFAGRVMNPAK